LASDIDFLTGHAGTGKTLQQHGSTRPLVAGPLGSPGSPGPLGFRAVQDEQMLHIIGPHIINANLWDCHVIENIIITIASNREPGILCETLADLFRQSLLRSSLLLLH